MRLYMAEEPRKVNPPDIEMALDMWRGINADPNKWARFEANGLSVYVEWGYILHGGDKERSIQTISFNLRRDGTVGVARYAHA